MTGGEKWGQDHWQNLALFVNMFSYENDTFLGSRLFTKDVKDGIS